MDDEARGRLHGLAVGWREALDIADAHRLRLRAAVLTELDAGVTVREVQDATGVSHTAIYEWIKERGTERLRD